MDTTHWSALIRGDKQALLALYESHYDGLYRYGYAISSDDALTRDAIHDLFVELWDRHTTLRKVNAVKPYLLRALRNTLLDVLAMQRQYAAEEEAGIEDYDLVSASVEAEQIAAETENARQVHLTHALTQLTPRQQEAITLRFFNALSYEEIANIMQLRYQSVRNLMTESLRALREVLEE